MSSLGLASAILWMSITREQLLVLNVPVLFLLRPHRQRNLLMTITAFRARKRQPAGHWNADVSTILLFPDLSVSLTDGGHL